MKVTGVTVTAEPATSGVPQCMVSGSWSCAEVPSRRVIVLPLSDCWMTAAGVGAGVGEGFGDGEGDAGWVAAGEDFTGREDDAGGTSGLGMATAVALGEGLGEGDAKVDDPSGEGPAGETARCPQPARRIAADTTPYAHALLLRRRHRCPQSMGDGLLGDGRR